MSASKKKIKLQNITGEDLLNIFLSYLKTDKKYKKEYIIIRLLLSTNLNSIEEFKVKKFKNENDIKNYILKKFKNIIVKKFGIKDYESLLYKMLNNLKKQLKENE